MSRFKHVVQTLYEPSFRSQKIAGMFDIPVEKYLKKSWDLELSLEEKDWNIGLILGSSGSGKTTIAKELFKNKIHTNFSWNKNCFLDDFDENIEIKNIVETLSKVGFSSPPQWLLPFNVLSNGQKFRAELARCCLEYENLFVFDEFTSVVDRQVAKIGSNAFQKIIRKNNKQFVAISCHYDIEEWLEPDWVLDLSENKFYWRSLRRPEIKLQIFRVDKKIWEIFKGNHYLNSDINSSSVCFCGFINETPVVFTSSLPFVGKLKGNKFAKREHRSVCLPDYQGIGLGNIMSNFIASLWSGLDYRYFSSTSHPSMINSRIKSKKWILTHQGRTSIDKNLNLSRACNRLISSFEYVGEKLNKIEALNILSNKM